MARCRICEEVYQKRGISQKACSVACSIEWVNRQKAKTQEKAEKLDRKETKTKLINLKPISYFANIAQTVVNKYVRLKAQANGEGCYTCGKHTGKMNAGHFKSRGANSALRYYLPQIRLQCEPCNSYNSGRADVFRANLIREHGQAWMDNLESIDRNRRYTREYLERLAQVFRKKIKRLEGRLGAKENPH